MSDYTADCINCYHRSHLGKPCPYCPADSKDNPNARCKEYTRADIFAARSLARIEQGIGQGHGQLMMALSTIFDLMAEAYPEAADRLQVKLKERQAAAEAEIELQRTKHLAEADMALQAAKEAEERREMEKLVEGYQEQNNVIQFPSKVAEEAEDEEPEPPKAGAQ